MIIRFIMSFLATLALNIRFDIPQDMNHLASESKMLNIFYNFQGSLTGTMATASTATITIIVKTNVRRHDFQFAKYVNFMYKSFPVRCF